MKRIIRAGERWGVKDRKKRKICRKRQRKVERYEERGRESYSLCRKSYCDVGRYIYIARDRKGEFE